MRRILVISGSKIEKNGQVLLLEIQENYESHPDGKIVQM
jgi:hypothetical protein